MRASAGDLPLGGPEVLAPTGGNVLGDGLAAGSVLAPCHAPVQC